MSKSLRHVILSTPQLSHDTLWPFLYPCLHSVLPQSTGLLYTSVVRSKHAHERRRLFSTRSRRTEQQALTASINHDSPPPFAAQGSITANEPAHDHLNPHPNDYQHPPFLDKHIITISSGAGGHGAVSFLREKYIAEGPPNGGNGGNGGSICITTSKEESSLYKLARRGPSVHAGRGRNGRGHSRGGKAGEDILLTVPMGTTVRELWRENLDESDDRSQAWMAYPGMDKKEQRTAAPPRKRAPRGPTTIASALQPGDAIRLDLDRPMEAPLVLAAGASGGLGNPHFVSRDDPRPKWATRGAKGIKMRLELELKMLADVGLVGLPNAGKSTLLRSLTNSRTRVGDWAFTTLQPVVGTVVLDDHKGRPRVEARGPGGIGIRASFTVADIPGLVEDAHLNKGLGLGFLRHIERAKVLVFVIDLQAGDATEALKALWREVGEYETLESQGLNADTESRMATERLEGRVGKDANPLPDAKAPISSKPWLVVANKADLGETRGNFTRLQEWTRALQDGHMEHPSGRPNAWRKKVIAVPVSAARAEGVNSIPRLIADLLD
ncbi:MAG: GTPase of the mitochondrial inner membrane that associates with the large ribosomal subunit [Chrysothrix sp. TS-e1954]|nr:MAG: GTPase of the mitochondrial inner membrane that associates with the large ribosomal subunit [Chrysothrix sp. TS-e1954]